jgi:hypothetical protein
MVDFAHLLERPRAGRGDAFTIDQVMEIPAQSPLWRTGLKENSATLNELRRLLEWLATHPGTGWQERWVNAGADRGLDWLDTVTDTRPFTPAVRNPRVRATGHLFLGQVILPSYDVLLAFRACKLFEHTRMIHEPDQFAALAAAADARGITDKHWSPAVKAISKIVLHTGRGPSLLTSDDVLEMYGWAMHHPRASSRPTNGLNLAWELLSAIGVTPVNSRLRHAVLRGQRPTADLVDDYEVAAPRIRDVLIRYLDARRPAVDYNSFRGDVAILAGLFWSDLERHHPGIDTLQLSPEQAGAWRERARVVVQADGTRRPRIDVLSIFTRVRTFYLDIQRWAVEDATWAEWAVPSPVRRNDCHGFAKEQRAAQSRMHQRIRERLPHLPLLADAAHRCMPTPPDC